MRRSALLFRHLYTPTEHVQDGVLTMDGERIGSIGPLTEESRARVHEELSGYEIYDAGDGVVLPGLIDLHIHGACGHDFLTAAPGIEFSAAAEGLCRFGVTGFLCTLGHAPWASLTNAVGCAAEVASAPSHGAVCLGLYLEGPFLNPARVGAGSPSFCLPPSGGALEEIESLARGHMRIMTLAAELNGATAIIASLARSGVVPAVGHTEATYEQVMAAVEAGASLATHAFNAMSPFHHRAPGTVGAILACAALSAELICDGQHVHPGAVRALLKAKGVGGVILVSDGTPLLGHGEGTYRDMQGRVIKAGDGACRTPDGSLVGGATPLDRCLVNFCRATGLSLGEATRTATLNPANLLGLGDRKGSLEPGKDADIAVVDQDFEVRMTFVRGRLCYARHPLG